MSDYFCRACNRSIKNYWRYLHTIKHISNSNEIKYTTFIKNVMVKDVTIVIDKHIERYKKRFVAFMFICKVKLLTIVGYPKTELLLKQYKKKIR